MKIVLVVIGLFLPAIVFCQTNETYLSDTTKIKWYISSESKDTIYQLKDTSPKGKWIVYYDQSKKLKAFEWESVKDIDDFYEETIWYRNGDIKSVRNISLTKDTLSNINYYKNRRVKNKNINVWEVNEKGWVLVIDSSFYDNGQIKQTPVDWKSFKKQKIVFYFQTGIKKYEMQWINGTLVDEYKEYFESGKIKIIGNYLNPMDIDPSTIPSSRHSIEHGIWKYFNEEGKLIKEEQFENGKILNAAEK